jgi:hypothetical protein
MSGDNAAIADVIDASQIPHIKALGVVMGTLQLSGIVMADRNIDGLITSGWGSRTGGLLRPWLVNLLPYNGGTIIKATGVYFNRFGITGAFSTRTDGMMLRWSASALVIDPNNVYACPTLTAGSAEGTQGKGPSSYAQFSLSNGAASSPTIYDQTRGMSLVLDNGFVVQPWVQDTVNRIAGGCSPGTISGAFSTTQLNGATNVIPQASGNYPLTLNIPTGDATSTLKINTALSWDSLSRSMMPSDFYQGSLSYSLFGGSATNGTSSYPVVASYS